MRILMVQDRDGHYVSKKADHVWITRQLERKINEVVQGLRAMGANMEKCYHDLDASDDAEDQLEELRSMLQMMSTDNYGARPTGNDTVDGNSFIEWVPGEYKTLLHMPEMFIGKLLGTGGKRIQVGSITHNASGNHYLH
jgi:hypothetical protein